MQSFSKLSLVGGVFILSCACSAQSSPASTAPTPAPAPPVQTAAAPAAQAAPAPTVPPIVFSGAFDVYYGYNFNRPPGIDSTGPGLRNFDFKDQNISLGLAELGVSRATSDTSRFGFTLKFAAGPTEDLLTSPGDDDNKILLQGYGTYAVPFGKKSINVDIGKFVTHMGEEVIEPSGNWNFSRSLLFQYFIPYYHAGIRAAVPLSDTVTATGYVYNGWNNVSFDSNKSKAYGLEVSFNPNANNTFIFNGLTSSEPINLNYTDSSNNPAVFTQNEPKTTLEGIWSHTFNSNLTGMVDVNYDFGSNAALAGAMPPGVNESDWSAYGVAAYLKYAFKGGSYLALRGEYVRDTDGFIFGLGNANAKEVTLTYSLQNPLFKGAELRLEYRYDSCSVPGLFTGSSDTHQNTITLSHIFTF